jgi:hypothetical protein
LDGSHYDAFDLIDDIRAEIVDNLTRMPKWMIVILIIQRLCHELADVEGREY